MDYTLELIVVPVSDVDRAKAFYIDQMGFELDVDSSAGPDFRVVQLTPPGSACSIAIGTGIGPMAPGTLHGLHLLRRRHRGGPRRADRTRRRRQRAVPLRGGRPDRLASTRSGGATRRS